MAHIFQLILIILLIFPLSRVVLRFREGQLTLPFFIFWLSVWTVALGVILYPSLTTKFAKIVGINRGIDVVVYASIIILFYLVFRIYIAIEDIHREISEIVRLISLRKHPRKSKRK